MEEKKYKFDPFKFLSDREHSIPPSDEDKLSFNNYMVSSALSMHKKYIKYTEYTNTIYFSKLTKEQQCLAYSTLNRNAFPFVPYLKKRQSIKNKDIIKKISTLFNVTEKEANRIINDKFIDIDKAINLYMELYEPHELISSKTGKLLKR